MHRPATLRTLLTLLASALAAVVLVLPPATPARAQGPEALPPLVEEIQVEVVNVDVVVTDREGRLVPGLTADDFVVLEDGEPRPITNFYAFLDGRIRGEEAASEESGDSWPHPTTRRRMALLFDNNSLDKRDRNRAIEDLERFILEQFDGTYEWAVIAYSDHLQLMQPFTDDKTRVLGALGRVRDLPVPIRQSRATDRTYSEDPFMVEVSQNIARRTGRRVLDRPGPRGLTTVDFELRERMFEGLQSFAHTTGAVVETMRAHAGLPGRKSLVLVTGALETLPGGPQLLGHGLPGVGGPEKVDPMIALFHSELQRQFEVILQTANAAGFALYPISTEALLRGKAPYLDVERDAAMIFTSGERSAPSEIETETAPRVMAHGTGGKFFGTTLFYQAYDEIDERTANSYVLGFATEHRPDRKYHKIKVETKLRGLTVEHRRGYLHLSREDRLLEELSTPLAFPKDRGDFEVSIEVLPPQWEKKEATVTVAGTMSVADLTLIPQGDEMVGRIYVYLALYDREGNLVQLVRDQQDVRVAADRIAAAPADAPARFGLSVEGVERGDYTVTLTLRDEVTDRYGTGLGPLRLEQPDRRIPAS